MFRSAAKFFLAFLLLALPAARGAGVFSVSGFIDETLYTGNGMISMRFDSTGRLWVIEKIGRVLVFPPPSPTSASIGAPTVFADLSSQVNTSGERGMMGLALDPDFANNRYLYVLYATSTDQKIVRLTANATFTAMVPGSAFVLLQGLPNVANVHKAGDIGFHPNDPNNLYVMLGDDGDRNLVNLLTNYNGKILKISASDGRGLTTNPHYDGNLNSIASRVWSKQYRNPFRFTFDPAAPIPDVLYISENGDGDDRVARIAKGADGGWPNAFQANTGLGRIRIDTSSPSKTGIVIFRSGPFSVGGAPTMYNARHGNDVRRWTLTGPDLATQTFVPADNGGPFWSGFGVGIASFTAGPDNNLYYTVSGQGPSTGGQKLGRVRFIGGTSPVANFAPSPATGQSPLNVTFTDTSTAPGSTLASWSWNFGDGGTSAQQSPTHSYTQPGIYTVTQMVTNAQGLNNVKQSTITVYHQTSITLTGQISDARSLANPNLAAATELRFYQSDGVTPLSVTGGTGASGNVRAIAGGGAINLTFTAQLTGPGIVVSAGEAVDDGMQPALVGIPLSTTLGSQLATANFRLSDTMLRGQVLDSKGAVAQPDVGLARGAANSPYAFAGGRDFLGGSGNPPSGVNHRLVPDGLGYYHMPIVTGGGGATFYLDTTADTLVNSHGRVLRNVVVASGGDVVRNLTIGLYDGGTGEADLSGIAVTPNVNFTTQIQPILNNNCVACHDGIASNSAGLDLGAAASYSALVGAESTQAPGVMRVRPGSAARSYLMEKLNATVPQVGTSMRPGDPMPLAQRALIRDWINQLVPPDPNAPPIIDSSLTKTGVVAAPLVYQITAINLPTSFGATNLPPGLEINTSTGVISGTPSTAGTTHTTITATNANGTDTEVLVFTITVGPPPSITSALAVSAATGTPFSYTITAANNPSSFGATGLPANLNLHPTTGVISGTVSTAGTSQVTITATNANGTDTQTLVLSFVTNLSVGRPAFSSGTPLRPASNAVDTDFNNSRWETAHGIDPGWMYIDLGASKSVRKVVLKWENAAGRDYKLQITDDPNGTWTDMVTVTGNATVGEIVYDGLNFTGRYVRMYGTARTTPYGYSLFNFEVWGTDLPAASLAFSAAAYSVSEGAAATTATISVRRTGSNTAAVGVTASTTAGGTATAGSDFTATSTTLSWAAGDGADKTFTVPILADSLAEGNETVALQLTSPTGGATLGAPATATLTIADRPLDAWRFQVFGAQANAPEAQPLADYDHDGVNNFLEFYLGGNPTVADLGVLPVAGVSPTGKLQISFVRNLNSTGAVFTVEARNSLLTGSWQAIATKTGAAAWVTEPGVTVSDNGTTGEVTVVDSEPIGGPAPRFLRLRVERTTD